MERRFVLTEYDVNGFTINSVDLSYEDLERRIDAVITGRLRDSLTAKQLIPILLHGEKEGDMERRFVIFEDIGTDWKHAKESITESELKRRLDLIRQGVEARTMPWETVFDILLHGEGEKEIK